MVNAIKMKCITISPYNDILGDYSNPSNLHTCLGTILSIRHVLTAAICVCHPDTNSPFNLFNHRCENGSKTWYTCKSL